MKRTITDSLKRFPVAYRLLRRIHAFVASEPPIESPIQRRVQEAHTEIRKAFSNKNAAVFFVQVGANDGVTNDPLHDFVVNNENWTGILIEPVEPIFQRLKRNYPCADRLIFENVAIAQNRDMRKFYYVSDAAKELGDSVSSWYDQLGSFDKAHILKHCTGRNSPLQSYIVEQDVKCVPLQDVLDKHRVKKIDLIHIDAEGFDYGVLAQIDFSKYKPSIVLYEHYHLSADEKGKAGSLLESNGYTLIEFEEDTLARLYPS
jgi:FkbM family methyltransferase